MTLSEVFVAAAGSVTGRDHRRAERDGQDGHAVVVTDEVVAAVVTDGCSSGRSSEIGARVGAAWLAALIEHHFGAAATCAGESDVASASAVTRTFAGESDAAPAARARAGAARVVRDLLVRLERLARSLDPRGDVQAARVDEALLFGFLAAVVTRETTLVFGVGDGIVAVDGAVTVIDPGPANAPPYAAYALLGARLEPTVHFLGATDDVDVVAVATDGLAPLATPARRDALSDAHSLTALAADPRYARNPSLLRKRLIVLSGQGTFSDDATVAVVQRRRSALS